MGPPKRKPLAWLIARPDEPGRDLVRRTQLLLTVSLVGANLIGAAIVFAIASWVFPYPDVEDPGAARIANLIGVVVFFLVVTPIGVRWGTRRLGQARSWLIEDRDPTAEERRIVLRAPRRIVTVHLVIWSLAAIVFGVLNAAFSLELGAARGDHRCARRPDDLRVRLPARRAPAAAGGGAGARLGRRRAAPGSRGQDADPDGLGGWAPASRSSG